MVRFLQKQPEVIAYIRSQFSPNQIPDWVGDIDGGGYTEILRKAGLEVPNAMDEEDGGDDDGVGSMVDEESEEQEHVPTPPAKPSIGEQTVNHPHPTKLKKASHPHPTHPTPTPEIMGGKTPPKDELKKGLKSAVTPPKPTSLKDIPTPPLKLTRGQELPQRREKPEVRGSQDGLETAILEEVQRMQRHDPTLIPMEVGGYGKLVLNPQGVPVGIKPVEQSPVLDASRLNRLIAERLSEEDIELKTYALMKKVALNPAVTMGYSWVTSNVDTRADVY